MHNRNEQVCDLVQLLVGIHKVTEFLIESLEELAILICLDTSQLNFLLKLGESRSLGRFVLFQEL